VIKPKPGTSAPDAKKDSSGSSVGAALLAPPSAEGEEGVKSAAVAGSKQNAKNAQPQSAGADSNTGALLDEGEVPPPKESAPAAGTSATDKGAPEESQGEGQNSDD